MLYIMLRPSLRDVTSNNSSLKCQKPKTWRWNLCYTFRWGVNLQWPRCFQQCENPETHDNVDRLHHEVVPGESEEGSVTKTWSKFKCKNIISSEDFQPASHQIQFFITSAGFDTMLPTSNTETMNNPWCKTLHQGIVWHFPNSAHLIPSPRARP